MSKVIVIFAVFLTILAMGVSILTTIYLPNSLELMKAEIVETSAKNGFETKIESAAFKFPNLVEFSGVCVGDFSKNIRANAKSFQLEISFLDDVKAIFRQKIKKSKIGINDFSNFAKLKNVDFFVSGKEIFSDGEADLYFENGALKYDLSADKTGAFYFPVKKIEANGTIDSGFLGINSNVKILGGNLALKADCYLHTYLFKDVVLNFSGIEIKDIFPAAEVSGKMSATLLLGGDIDIKSNFAKILKEKQATCSIEINGFKYDNLKHSKTILSAVSFLGINNLDFSKITADLDYSRSKVKINNFLADNFKYAVSANGYYIPENQKIDFDVQIHFNPDMKFAIRKEIWNAMLTAEPKNEGRKIGGKVSGNVNNYSVSLDNDVMKKGVNSLLKEIEKLF
jgi:hypothetical protein